MSHRTDYRTDYRTGYRIGCRTRHRAGCRTGRKCAKLARYVLWKRDQGLVRLLTAKLKRRLFVVTGLIVVVIVSVLAIVAGSTAARVVTVAQALSETNQGQRVEVTGLVVDNSYTTEAGVLSFAIYDASAPAKQLLVRYQGSVSATFGNQVTAICTGIIAADGSLDCLTLVTKCPSKYETATDALAVSQLLGYGAQIYGKPVKVTGVVQAGTLVPAGQGQRFVLEDRSTGGGGASAGTGASANSPTGDSSASANSPTGDSSAASSAPTNQIPIYYDEALPQSIVDGTVLVITGSLDASGKFTATAVAQESQ